MRTPNNILLHALQPQYTMKISHHSATGTSHCAGVSAGGIWYRCLHMPRPDHPVEAGYSLPMLSPHHLPRQTLTARTEHTHRTHSHLLSLLPSASACPLRAGTYPCGHIPAPPHPTPPLGGSTAVPPSTSSRLDNTVQEKFPPDRKGLVLSKNGTMSFVWS